MSTERFSNFGLAQQDEDESGRYGMGSSHPRAHEADEEDEDEGVMHEVCGSCGETNRVLPPKGYKLQRLGGAAQQGVATRVHRGSG